MVEKARAPAWYWIVAVLAVIWNGFGCFDYVMTVTRNVAYLSAFPREYVAYLDTLPLWLVGFWALGVGGGLAGALLLLRRARLAAAAFGVSLLGLVVTSVYQWRDTEAPAISSADVAISVAIWLIALALLLFSLRMLRAGVLR
ncbi:hypothetical protein MTR65_18600 [Novosphingobium sp. 2637]|uniref:Sugar transporter n=2 Tax=Novosphingobium mangrovi (ex Hu et al. 2023) TaxID=2930094 RepID=A0ABT0AHP8_9SPHN|nr:hypothetical protein [Novosphingobium mangrovi (ex Hu et al. 2023)]MCJ1962702.1 hypothetical protein [Novosphingobium mangrovi (ex Hu et al. 2023)]